MQDNTSFAFSSENNFISSFITKRGLECFLSIASVQICRIEKLVCRNHVFAEFFKTGKC